MRPSTTNPSILRIVSVLIGNRAGMLQTQPCSTQEEAGNGWWLEIIEPEDTFCCHDIISPTPACPQKMLRYARHGLRWNGAGVKWNRAIGFDDRCLEGEPKVIRDSHYDLIGETCVQYLLHRMWTAQPTRELKLLNNQHSTHELQCIQPSNAMQRA